MVESAITSSKTSRTRLVACGALAACVAAGVAVGIVFSVSGSSPAAVERPPAPPLGEAFGIDTDPLAVTALRVVSASSDDVARDKCMADTANTTDTTAGWTIAGRNLNTNTSRDGNSSDPAAFAYLCMRQQRLSALASNATVLQALQVVVGGANCSTERATVFSPRGGVVLCAQPVDASLARATGMYISDVAVSFEPAYNLATPGWTSEWTSVATAAGKDPAYVSYKRPVRPISAVRALRVPAADAATACASQLGRQWEQGGSVGFADGNTANQTILCLERPLLNDTAVASVTKMLVDVAVARDSAACGEGVSAREQLTASVALCGKFASSADSVGYVSELRFQSASETASLEAATKYTDPVRVLALDSNTTLVYRRHTGIIVLNATNTTTEATAVAASTLEAKNATDNGLVFKIVQLADLHMTGDATHECRNPPKEMLDAGRICSEADTTAFVERVLDAERPDLVVFSGDNVEVPKGNSIEAALSAALGPVEKRQIPYALVFGNHDDENGQSRADMAERVVGRNAFSRMQWGPRAVSGVGNYELSVRAPRAGAWGAAGSAVFRLYFLDSHGYPDASRYPGVKSTYDWIKPDQVAYYKELARAARDNLVGNATSMADNATSTASNDTSDDDSDRNATAAVPAVMFFHIPIPEYASAGTAPRYRSGDKNENVASAEVHSNLFSALVEMGDVKATFVGHDHVNEYCYLRQGVQLCYGGGAGFAQAYGSAQFARRTRVVEWRVDERNRRRIVSWKRHYGAAFETRQHEEVLYDEQREAKSGDR